MDCHFFEATPSLTNRIRERMRNENLKRAEKEAIDLDVMNTDKGKEKGKNSFLDKPGPSTTKPRLAMAPFAASHTGNPFHHQTGDRTRHP